MSENVNEALKAAASFKARGIKQAALDVVAEYERKKAAPPEENIQRNEPSSQADPAPTEQSAAPLPSTSQPAAPAPEVEEEEAVETAEAKTERQREELSNDLSSDELITAVLETLEAESMDLDDYSVTVEEGYDNTAVINPNGKITYRVAESDDAAEAIALSQVRNDLESEPEIFNQDWLQGYVNEDRLRHDLYSDVEESIRQSPESYGWRPGYDADGYEQVRYNAEGEEDEDGEFDSDGQPISNSDEPSDDWFESKANEQLRDPVQYMKDIYGDDEGLKQAIRISGINIEEAARDAVAADGWQHWLARYDGNSYDLPSGGVYWRD